MGRNVTPLPPRQAVALAVVLLAVLTFLSVASARSTASTRSDAVQPAQAEVSSYRQRLLRGQQIRVRYDVPGQGTESALIRVDQRYERGATVAVLYDPARPARARTVEHWHPRSPWSLPAALIGLGTLFLVGSLLRLRRSRAG